MGGGIEGRKRKCEWDPGENKVMGAFPASLQQVIGHSAGAGADVGVTDGLKLGPLIKE